MTNINNDIELNATRFDRLKAVKNPGIYLAKGDSITNSVAGLVDFAGADIKANRFIGGAGFYPEKTLYVSPSFTNDAAARTYYKIADALAAVAANEPATILVYEGTYTEAITAKSKVSIIGVNNKKVIITSDGLITVNVTDVTDFELRNLTIENTNTSENSYCLYIGGNADSDLPNLDFVDLFIRKTSAVDTTANAVYCTATSFLMKGCYLTIQGNGLLGMNVILIYLAEYANPIFDGCKFRIANSISGDCSIYTTDDSTTDFTISNCQNYSNGFFINCTSSSGANNGRSFFNISNVADNNFGNLIDSPNNIIDSDFIIR